MPVRVTLSIQVYMLVELLLPPAESARVNVMAVGEADWIFAKVPPIAMSADAEVFATAAWVAVFGVNVPPAKLLDTRKLAGEVSPPTVPYEKERLVKLMFRPTGMVTVKVCVSVSAFLSARIWPETDWMPPVGDVAVQFETVTPSPEKPLLETGTMAVCPVLLPFIAVVVVSKPNTMVAAWLDAAVMQSAMTGSRSDLNFMTVEELF